MKLHRHLTALAVGAMAPVVAVAVVAGVFLVQRERAGIEREAIGRTRAAMSAIDAELRGVISSLDALAASKHLKAGDMRAFEEEARRIMASQPHWLNVGLTTRERIQVIDAVLPFGEPRPFAGDEKTFDAVVKTGRLTIGNVAIGPAIEVPAVRVRMPILQDGVVCYVLSVPVKIELFNDALRAQALPAGWVIVVADRNRRFIARIPPRPTGDPISDSFREAIIRAPEGFFRRETVEGFQTYTPYVTSPLSRWVLGIAVPASVINAGGIRVAAIVAIGLVIALGVAWWFAWLMARPIARPIAALAASTRATEPGGSLALPDPGSIDEIVQLHGTLHHAMDNIRERQELLQRARGARPWDDLIAVL